MTMYPTEPRRRQNFANGTTVSSPGELAGQYPSLLGSGGGPLPSQPAMAGRLPYSQFQPIRAAQRGDLSSYPQARMTAPIRYETNIAAQNHSAANFAQNAPAPQMGKPLNNLTITEQQARSMWENASKNYGGAGSPGAASEFNSMGQRYGFDANRLMRKWGDEGTIAKFDFQQPGDHPMPVEQKPVVTFNDPRTHTAIVESSQGRGMYDVTPGGRVGMRVGPMMGDPLPMMQPRMEMPAPHGPQPGYSPVPQYDPAAAAQASNEILARNGNPSTRPAMQPSATPPVMNGGPRPYDPGVVPGSPESPEGRDLARRQAARSAYVTRHNEQGDEATANADSLRTVAENQSTGYSPRDRLAQERINASREHDQAVDQRTGQVIESRENLAEKNNAAQGQRQEQRLNDADEKSLSQYQLDLQKHYQQYQPFDTESGQKMAPAQIVELVNRQVADRRKSLGGARGGGQQQSNANTPYQSQQQPQQAPPAQAAPAQQQQAPQQQGGGPEQYVPSGFQKNPDGSYTGPDGHTHHIQIVNGRYRLMPS